MGLRHRADGALDHLADPEIEVEGEFDNGLNDKFFVNGCQLVNNPAEP